MQKIKVIVCLGEEDPGINMANAIADLIHQNIMNLPEENRAWVYEHLLKSIEGKEK